jgi:hypothetical protein
MGSSGGTGAARRTLGVLGATLLVLAAATPAGAHGGVTGPRDVVQDYGVLLFLVATALIGAGVLAWVTCSPQGGEDDDEDDLAAEGAPPSGPAGAPAAPDGDHPALTGPRAPETSRAGR